MGIASSDGSIRLQMVGRAGQLLWSTNTGGGRPDSATAYIHLGGKQIAEWDTVKGVQYVHTDALGSPVARTNASKVQTSWSRYEPFGLTAAGTNKTKAMWGLHMGYL